MSISYRRYEILLPRQFNDGRQVPPRLIAETLIALRRQFGAASCETQTIQGQWQHQREVYHDQLVRVFVDVEDVSESREFFLRFKQKLKHEFNQIDIWMTSHPIDVL
ncbi:MAG TPA: hypothetical protein VGR14_05350 [Verrucomicrobiae bacterium]|nr:hypothetical protein [Verrucomicrobiae bacterium]